MNKSITATGAVRLSSTTGTSTSLANASQAPRDADEPMTAAANCMPQAARACVNRRTAIMNIAVSATALVSATTLTEAAIAIRPELEAQLTTPAEIRLLQLAGMVATAAQELDEIERTVSEASKEYEALVPERPAALRWSPIDPVWIGYDMEELPNNKYRLWCSAAGINRARRGNEKLVSYYEYVGPEGGDHNIKDDDFDDNQAPYAPKPHIAHLYEARVRDQDIERSNEVVAADDQFKGECDALRAKLELDNLSKLLDASADKLYGLYYEATDLPARSLLSLRAKAAMLLAYEWRKGINHEELEVDDMLRSIISGLLGLSNSAAAPLEPTVTIPIDAVSDPIFALIQAHRTASRGQTAAYTQFSRLENELPSDRRRSQIDTWEETIVKTDDPRWIQLQRDLHSFYTAATAAAVAMIAEPPATVAGAIALIQYVAEADVDGMEFPDSLVESDEQKMGKSWHFYLHKNLAATFAAYTA